jgi:hypothetical protein
VKVVHPLQVHQRTKFNGPTLTSSSLFIHLNSMIVRHFVMIKASGLKYDIEVAFNDITFMLNFNENLQIDSKVIRWKNSRADRQRGDLISLTFLFMKVD